MAAAGLRRAARAAAALSARGSVWQRSLAALWASQFCVTAGLTVIVPLLPFYMETLGATDPADNRFWSGLALAAPALPLMLAAPLWGRLGDRYGRKWMVVRAVFGIAASVLLMGFAQTPLQFLVCRLLQGAFGGVDDAAAAFASSQAPAEVRGKAMGILQSSTAGGALVGPLLGGLLATRWGFSALILATGLLISLSGIAAIAVLRETRREEAGRAPQAALGAVLREMLGQRRSRAFILAGLFVQIGAYGLVNIFAVHVRTLLPHPETAAGWVGALQALTWGTTLVGAAWWGRRNDRAPLERNFTLAACGGAISMALQAAPSQAAWLFPLRMAQGFCQSALGQSIFLWVGRDAGPAQAGVRIGVANSFLTLGQVLGALGGAALAAWLPARWMFVLMGGCCALGALLVWRANAAAEQPQTSARLESEVMP